MRPRSIHLLQSAYDLDASQLLLVIRLATAVLEEHLCVLSRKPVCFTPGLSQLQRRSSAFAPTVSVSATRSSNETSQPPQSAATASSRAPFYISPVNLSLSISCSHSADVLNKNRVCGFLRTSNRINVLLSRAQHERYIISNTDTSAHIRMWGDVLDMLNKDGNVGPHLELCCPRHPETPLQITTPDDFSVVSPEAGCDLLCGQRLPCGHSGINKCHSDGIHQATHCTLWPTSLPARDTGTGARTATLSLSASAACQCRLCAALSVMCLLEVRTMHRRLGCRMLRTLRGILGA